MRTAQIFYARVTQAADALGGVVGGPVVDDDHLEGRMSLGEGALDRLHHHAAAVVGGDHDGHRDGTRSVRHCASASQKSYP